MALWRRMSVASKLLAMTLVLALGAVALSAGASLVHGHRTMRKNHEQRFELLAQLVADYCTGPLLFEDARGAEQILGRLHLLTPVAVAQLQDAGGNVVARYSRPGGGSAAEEMPAESAEQIPAGMFVVSRPVVYEGRQLGTLRLWTSTAAIGARDLESLRFDVLVALGALGLCGLLAMRMQRRVVGPIRHLSDLMEGISHSGTLDVRAEPVSSDEIGSLQRGFNAMLAQLERRKKERDMSEARMRALIAALPDLVVALDAQGRVEEIPAGPVLPKTTAVRLETGRHILDTLGEGMQPAEREAVDRALRGDGPAQLSYSLRVAGETRFFEGVLTGVDVPSLRNGTARSRLLVARDVTESRALAEQLAQASKMEAVGQLAGGIAHDFNNLLAGIVGYTELIGLEAETLDSDEITYAARGIRGAADRAGVLVSKLMEFSRRKSAAFTPVDVHGAIGSVVDMLKCTIDPRVDIDVDLQASRSVVTGSMASLVTALLNLGLNGRDAMPDGGRLSFASRTLHLDERLSSTDAEHPAPGDYVEIRVADTGHGMARELQRQIFNPFFTTKPPGKGSGLGLTSVDSAIRAHKGFVRVTSGVGKGSLFRIFLPLVEDDSVVSKIAPELPTGRETILFVDDDPLVRDAIVPLLQRQGYSVRAFGRAVDAVGAFASEWQAIDLAIVDMIMPEMSGEETIKALRERAPSLPVLVISGHSPRGLAPAEELGVDGWLHKPFSFEDLARTVARILKDSRERLTSDATQQPSLESASEAKESQMS